MYWLLVILIAESLVFIQFNTAEELLPQSGLYFMIRNNTYRPGDIIPITNVGEQPSNRSDPGSTLVCVTTNVNTNCCRRMDTINNESAIGDWYFPNGQIVSRLNTTIKRFRQKQQIRLSINATYYDAPFGTYTCSVPDENGMLVNASITLTSIISLSITPSNLIGTAGESDITLMCTVNLSDTGTPTFTWIIPQSCDSVTFQEDHKSLTNTLTLGRLRESCSGVYTCQVSVESSTMNASVTVTVIVPLINVTITESILPVVHGSYTLTCEDIKETLIGLTLLCALLSLLSVWLDYMTFV